VVVLLFENGRRPNSVFEWLPNKRLREIYHGSYFDFGYLLDPFQVLAMSDFDDGAYRLRDIAPDRFFRSEYFNRYYQQTLIVDELGALERIDRERVAHLSIARCQGGQRYSKRARASFASLARVLMPVIILHCHALFDARNEQRPWSSKERLSDRIRPDRHVGRTRISQREAEIASMIVQGHSTTSIGLNLGISPQTVKVHRRNIYRKLEISSQAELLARFLS
jgi:DNA-binding CsgD family transcriptional regulator